MAATADALWYISFAATDGFRGATVVAGNTAELALAEATRLGLNPGGEAAILEVPDEGRHELSRYLNRLITKAELLADGARRVGDCPERIQQRFKEEAQKVCEDCNDG